MQFRALLACFACAAAPACLAQAVSPSENFIDSIGINTHLIYSNTQYATEWPSVLTALQNLGVHHVRDAYFTDSNPSDPIYASHQQLAASGIHCDFIVPYGVSNLQQNIQQFALWTGDMESLEDPNEYDDQGITNWQANLSAYLPTVQQAAASVGVPVLGPSFVNSGSYTAMGDISQYINVNNTHDYFAGYNPETAGWGASRDAQGNRYASFGWWIDAGNQDAPGVPQMITETGYLTPPDGSGSTVIPASVEPGYITRTLLEAYRLGIVRTYLYELVDEPYRSQGWGLLYQNLAPKPAYTALQNLISLLSDPGPAFTPHPLRYTLSGSTNNVHQLLLQKRDGSYWLALWLGVSSYNLTSQTVVSPTPQSVQLRIQGPASVHTVYNFQNDGTVKQSTVRGPQASTFSITDQVTLLQMH